MPPRTRRGAREAPPSTVQYRRLLTRISRANALAERNAGEIEKLRDELKVQFKRLAQVQAELDTIKKAWEKMQG